jgi:hypothetical protein
MMHQALVRCNSKLQHQATAASNTIDFNIIGTIKATINLASIKVHKSNRFSVKICFSPLGRVAVHG